MDPQLSDRRRGTRWAHRNSVEQPPPTLAYRLLGIIVLPCTKCVIALALHDARARADLIECPYQANRVSGPDHPTTVVSTDDVSEIGIYWTDGKNGLPRGESAVRLARHYDCFGSTLHSDEGDMRTKHSVHPRLVREWAVEPDPRADAGRHCQDSRLE